MHAHETAFPLQPAQRQGLTQATEAKVHSSSHPLSAWQATPQRAAGEYRRSCPLPLGRLGDRGLVPMQDDLMDRRDACSDPAHHRDRHRIAERPVAWAIGGQPAAILNQRVIVGKSLQAFALARRQTSHSHSRVQDVRRPAAGVGAIESPRRPVGSSQRSSNGYLSTAIGTTARTDGEIFHAHRPGLPEHAISSSPLTE